MVVVVVFDLDLSNIMGAGVFWPPALDCLCKGSDIASIISRLENEK